MRRLRPKYTDEELAAVYATQYDHTKWSDHVERINYASRYIPLLLSFFRDNLLPNEPEITSVADLSCGDGAIIDKVPGMTRVIKGDFTYGYEFHGKIEDTIEQIPKVDFFILSETLEHIDDPLSLLKQIRAKSRYLYLSTPLDEQDTGNPEHYWGWDAQDIHELLLKAGWTPAIYGVFEPQTAKYYTYQNWGAG